jgi:hypothetical protein
VRATVAKAAGRNGNGAAPRWDVRPAATLDEAVTLLAGVNNLVLGLPVSAVLAQRLRLPAVDAADFNDMVRLQVEKALPYPPEEVTTDFEVIEQTEEGSVVSAVAVHNQRLAEFAAPLLSRGIIPRQVTLYAAQRAATHAAAGRAFMIYPENEELVCAISEEGKIGFTHSLDGNDSAQLQRNLPQLALSAELQGINTSFPVVLIDESLMDLRDTVQGLFVSQADLISVEVPPADTKLNLLPDSWRQRRVELQRQAEWKKRLIWAGGAYAVVLLLFAAYVFAVRFQASQLDEKIARDEPITAFVKSTETALEGAGASDRPEVLSDRDPAPHLREPAGPGRADYHLHAVGAAAADRWRGQHRRARVSICGVDKEARRSTALPVRHGGAAHPAERPCAVPPGGETEMMPLWFQRLNSRERVLSLIVAGALVLLVNWMIWGSLLGMLERTKAEYAGRQALRQQQEVFLRERGMWQKRDEWLQQNQPPLNNPAEASTLLETVKEVAGKHSVLLENPSIGSSESTPNYQTVSVSVDTKSEWKPLVRFLYDLQQPQSFVVMENVNLQIDSANPTQMRGKFKIARWFAPKPGGAK